MGALLRLSARRCDYGPVSQTEGGKGARLRERAHPRVLPPTCARARARLTQAWSERLISSDIPRSHGHLITVLPLITNRKTFDSPWVRLFNYWVTANETAVVNPPPPPLFPTPTGLNETLLFSTPISQHYSSRLCYKVDV